MNFIDVIFTLIIKHNKTILLRGWFTLNFYVTHK